MNESAEYGHEEPWNEMEAQAREIVDFDQADEWPWPTLDRVATVSDARVFLAYLDQLRSTCTDSRAVSYCAYALGKLAERLRVRDFEQEVIIGQKVRRGGKMGLERGHGTDEERASRDRQIVECYEKLLEVGTPKTKALNETGKTFKLNPRQIRRILKEYFTKKM